MMQETYPCYVRIRESPEEEDLIEVPTEQDGTILLATLKAQFPDAIGLRFKTAAGHWRGVKLGDDILDIPLDGWGDREYSVTDKNREKRKRKPVVQTSLPPQTSPLEVRGDLEYSIIATEPKKHKLGPVVHTFPPPQTSPLMTNASHKRTATPLEDRGDCEYSITDRIPEKRFCVKSEMLKDMIVFGLPYSATEDDLKAHFEKFGTLAHYEIKFDEETKKSRGFGYIRYTSVEEVKAVLAYHHHSIGGRKLEVRFPNKKGMDTIPTNLHIRRLPKGTTQHDIYDCFSEYSPLHSVYTPPEFRGFGNVTLRSKVEAEEVLNSTFAIKGKVIEIQLGNPREMQNSDDGNTQMIGWKYPDVRTS